MSSSVLVETNDPVVDVIELLTFFLPFDLNDTLLFWRIFQQLRDESAGFGTTVAIGSRSDQQHDRDRAYRATLKGTIQLFLLYI